MVDESRRIRYAPRRATSSLLHAVVLSPYSDLQIVV